MCGRGHAWQGGMHGRGACTAGVYMVVGCMPHMPPPPPANTMRYGDTVNERAVRILLECIFVNIFFFRPCCKHLRSARVLIVLGFT